MADYMLPYQPSLASATNTRVDSACKHHQQCRVSTDDMLSLTLPKNDALELQRNKYRYCIHKDELTLGVSRPWLIEDARKKVNNAYPRVISNLGMLDGMSKDTETPRKMLMYMYHFAQTMRDKRHIINWFNNQDFYADVIHPVHGAMPLPKELLFFPPSDTDPAKLAEPTKKWLPIMHDHVAMGYAQTLGWAHSLTGDTMTTVMIGGLRTVMNGDFEVFTGDVIQWYWPFELNCFQKDGKRRPVVLDSLYSNHNGNLVPHNMDPQMDIRADGAGPSPWKLERDASAREGYHKKIYGQPKNSDKVVPRIKPYWHDDVYPRMFDKLRVFAVAISCARPHEMCDIKICRQSL
jgi:hypothetical protein